MAPVALHGLVSALSGAVVQAQDNIEKYQLEQIGRFFDREGRPDSIQVMLPKLGVPKSDEDYTVLVVPRMALVQPTLLSISEFQINFDVELGDLGGAPDGSAPQPSSAGGAGVEGPLGTDAAAAPRAGLLSRISRLFGARRVVPDIGPRPSEAMPRLSDGRVPVRETVAADPPPPPEISVGIGPKDTSTITAQAFLKIAVQPLSDGMVRLLNHLNKTF
jgi:Protein of unknown function (DUF2589)